MIDHNWKKKNIFLILCGSSVSIMESDVMGRKSPLHDRQTSTLEIKPFDYLESSVFFLNIVMKINCWRMEYWVGFQDI